MQNTKRKRQSKKYIKLGKTELVNNSRLESNGILRDLLIG